jgi:hypothetical protein
VKYLLLFILAIGALFALDLWLAQTVVWGLSLYHVDSGIWGPYLLLTAATSVVTTGVAFGGNRAS